MNWTDEQLNIINSSGNIRINAIAGSGKTTTILHYAARQPKDTKILYLAFNKSVKLEAQRKCLELGLNNIKVETAHSLAFKHIIKSSNFTVCKNGYKIYDLASLLNIQAKGDSYLKFLLANHINKFASYFCNSTSEKIQNLNYANTIADQKAKIFVENYYQSIEKGTRQFLAKMESKEIEIIHDFYLKKFQLINPILNFDYILFDEGQDASPAMLDIFLKQAAKKIIVGDTHQQIYAWRYAINSLEQVPFKSHKLTTSFRFHQDIADLANGILNWKSHLYKYESTPIKGLGKPNKEKSQTKAIIARSNLGLLLKAIEYVVENKKANQIYFEGNINSYTYAEDGTSLYDVLNLFLGKKYLIKDALIKTMNSLEQLEDYIEKTEDIQLAMMVKIVKQYGKEIPHILNEIKKKHIPTDHKENAEVIFSTVHRSKGMEYDSVLLVNDFMEEAKIKSFGKKFIQENLKKINEEINILYVAITRTKKHLFIPENLIPSHIKKSPYIHPIREESIEEISINEVIKIMVKPEKAYSLVEVRKTHKQAYASWTEAMDNELKKMYNFGTSVKEMAIYFNRTTGAIKSRIKKLQL